MTDTPDTAPARDYRDTVFLPKTDFPMKAGLPAKEPGILARWQAMNLYEKHARRAPGRDKFILHDGRRTRATCISAMRSTTSSRTRCAARRGCSARTRRTCPAGTATACRSSGRSRSSIAPRSGTRTRSPAEFRAECRAYAQHWVDVQREQLKRLGINGDWDHPYLTMDFAAEATIVTELMKFAGAGQLYRGAKPVMWSPVEKTALAEAEVEYEDVVSTQIDVAFEIVDAPNAPECVAFARITQFPQ